MLVYDSGPVEYQHFPHMIILIERQPDDGEYAGIDEANNDLANLHLTLTPLPHGRI